MLWQEDEYTYTFSNGKNITIKYLSINELNEEIKQLIDNEIVYICFRDDSFTKEKAKRKIKSFLDSKSKDGKKGAIAEFFIHLYLKEKGFIQECLYCNLEENSAKKGFDGLYTYNNETWYMESKSGGNRNIEHKDKVIEAYHDLKNKFSSNVSNDPFLNAYNHAKCVGSSKKLLKLLIDFSNEFEDKKLDLNDFNIIPSGTLFIEDYEKNYDSKQIQNQITRYFCSKKFNNIIAICISNNLFDSFQKYLIEE